VAWFIVNDEIKLAAYRVFGEAPSQLLTRRG
jgi:hypothetical protein